MSLSPISVSILFMWYEYIFTLYILFLHLFISFTFVFHFISYRVVIPSLILGVSLLCCFCVRVLKCKLHNNKSDALRVEGGTTFVSFVALKVEFTTLSTRILLFISLPLVWTAEEEKINKTKAKRKQHHFVWHCRRDREIYLCVNEYKCLQGVSSCCAFILALSRKKSV